MTADLALARASEDAEDSVVVPIEFYRQFVTARRAARLSDEDRAAVIDVARGDRRYAVVQGEALGFLAELDDDLIESFIIDPPYSSGGQYRGDRARDTDEKYVMKYVKIDRPNFSGDNRDQRAFQLWCALWLSEAHRVSKLGGVICIFTDWRQIAATIDAVQMGGWVYRGIVPWDKTEGCRPQKGRFASQCEFIVWASKGAMPDDRLGESGPDTCLPGCFRIFSNPAEKWHQTGKPEELMQSVAKICPADGIIVDLFAGSHTTGIGALRAGRRYIGLELTTAYDAIGRERLEAERQGINLRDSRSGQRGLFEAKP